MANEKILDMTKSAAANETAVNEKFDELSQQGGGSGGASEEQFIPESVAYNAYGNGIDIGDIEDNNPFATGSMVNIYNSIKTVKAVRETSMRIDGQLTYTHCPAMAIHNGIAYIAFFCNTGGNDYLNDKASIHLSIVDVSQITMQALTPILVADKDSIATLASGSTVVLSDGAIDPNLWIDTGNGIVRITFTARRGDEYYYCYRDYNISAGTLGDIRTCKIISGNDSVDFSEVNFRIVSPDSSKAYGQLYMTSQYGELDGWNYICLGAGSNLPSGYVFKTQDFITFTPVSVPYVVQNGQNVDANLNIKYEMAIHPVNTAWGWKLRFAVRTHGAKMKIGWLGTDGKVEDIREIHDGNSRHCWFTVNGDYAALHLMHNVDSGAYRNMTGVEKVHPNSTAASNVTRVSTCFQMIYPSIAEYEGYIIVSYQGDGAHHVRLARLPKPKKAYEVLPTFERMLDVFADGTRDNPIEYTNTLSINLEEGKYYKQTNVVYRCVFSSALTNRAALSTFVGKNLEVVS